MPTTLHPRSAGVTDEEQMTALALPIRDPLWFLSRQWQTGGLHADDAGDPVQVSIQPTTVAIRELDSGAWRSRLEAEAEVDPVGWDTATCVRATTELFRLLRDEGMKRDRIAAVRSTLAAAFPTHAACVNSLSVPYSGRLPDLAALVGALAASLDLTGAGPLPSLPGLSVTDDPQLEPALRTWFAFVNAQRAVAGVTVSAPPPRWDDHRLSYQATLHADLPAGSVDLTLDAYDGTDPDWYSFDRSTLEATAPAAAAVTVRPTPVTFPGMPEPRLWEFENGQVNLDLLRATDPSRALLATFAHAYANDWFLIPLDVAPGCTTIDTLSVRDSFGDVISVKSAAALDGPQGRWRMWDLTPSTESENDTAGGLRLFLPPSPAPLEGPQLDEVLIARDELANLGWSIELATHDPDGSAVDRNRRWLQLRPPSDPTYQPGVASDQLNYRLGTSLPDYWYPLLATGADSNRRLEFADLPPGASEVPDAGVCGVTIPHLTGNSLADEEAAGTGVSVSRSNRLHHAAGHRVGWRARTRRPGRGEASSGLRFDVLGAPAPIPNLVRNPDFSLALRQPPKPLVGRAVPGSSAAEGWTLWNNADTTTSTRLEPTTRPGGNGWMLRIETGGAGCGLVCQWGPNDTGPLAAVAETWVYVVRGKVVLGSGNGGNITVDRTSTTVGRWELMRAASGRAPVNEMIIYSESIDGAEYYVDSVAVRAVG